MNYSMPGINLIDPIASQTQERFRFNEVVLLDNDSVDLFVNGTIIQAALLAKQIQHELLPEAFFEKLKNHNQESDVPELIVLNLDMEDEKGDSFLEKFNTLSDFVRNKCKIIIVSSSDKKEVKYKALMNPNVIRFLKKPIDISHLKDFVIQ